MDFYKKRFLQPAMVAIVIDTYNKCFSIDRLNTNSKNKRATKVREYNILKAVTISRLHVA